MYAQPLLPQMQLEQQFKNRIAVILSRSQAYANGITQVMDYQVSEDGVITGTAKGRDWRLVKFTINPDKNQVTYKLASNLDSRTDATLSRLGKKYKCVKGLPCGGGCINSQKTCRITGGTVATKKELQQLKTVGLSLRSALAPIKPAQPEEKYENLTIRELQALARNEGVYRSNHQNKEQLIENLKALKADPEAQENLRRTLEKRRATRKIAEKNLPKSLVHLWKGIEQAQKVAGRNPTAAGIITTGLILGLAQSQVTTMRDRYRSGLNDSAKIAMERSQKLPILDTNKPNITFAVGGFGGIGSSGEKMRDLLEAPIDNTKGEAWFNKSNLIVPFNSKEFDIPTPSASPKNLDGSYNPMYLAEVTKNGFGKFLQNVQRGRNDAAVDLAAEIYAYGDRYRNKTINVLGHGAGGNVVREATEIVARMKPNKGKGLAGKDLLERMNIVNLGTPFFGMTTDKGWKNGDIKHRTITSSGDPFSMLPKQAAQWISTVRGHEVGDYLKNLDVRDRLRESFGYYSNSLLGRREADLKRKETRNAIGEAISEISPTAGRLWNQIGKIQDKAKEHPVAASITTGAVVTGVGVLTYNKMQRRYRDGLTTSASQAENMYSFKDVGSGDKKKRNFYVNGAKIDYVPNNNITFVVGGAGGSSTPDDIINSLPDDVKGTVGKKGKLTGGQTYFVPFEDGIAKNVGNQGANNNAAHHGEILTKGYGGILKRNLGGVRPDIITGGVKIPGTGTTEVRNQDAIALASQLYAYAQQAKYTKQKNIQINILASNVGGLTTREALEILAKMGTSGEGLRIAKNVNFVSLGTPGFGFVNDNPGSGDNRKFVSQELNLMGIQDPIASKLSGRENGKTIRVNNVNGHDARSYLGNDEVLREVKKVFRYGQTV